MEQEGKFKIAGIVERLGAPKDSILGYPIIGNDDELPKLREQYNLALVTVGQIKNTGVRKKLFKKLKDLGFKLPSIISKKAYVSSHANLSDGIIVMHNVVINAGAQIGRNCIINTKSIVEHDVRIGDHCHIATGSIVNGDAKVGNETFIGSGSVVREGIQIGQRSFIAAGTRVMKDLPPNSNFRNRL